MREMPPRCLCFRVGDSYVVCLCAAEAQHQDEVMRPATPPHEQLRSPVANAQAAESSAAMGIWQRLWGECGDSLPVLLAGEGLRLLVCRMM